MLPGADKTIQKLKSEGDEIYFITARLMNIKDCDTEGITKRSLEKFNIPYDKLYLHISDKLTFFKENGIDLCIEDSFDTCRQLTDNGIKSILMTTKIVNLCPDVVSKYKLELSQPLLVEIPDRHGSAQIGKTIDKYISEAIGIKL